MASYQDMFNYQTGGQSAGQVFQDLTGQNTPPLVTPINNNLWTMIYNSTGELPENAKPAPKPPDPDDPEYRKKLDQAAMIERNMRGRASTYLTGPGGLLSDPSLFKASLLGN